MAALYALLIFAVLLGHIAIGRVWLGRVHTTYLPGFLWRPLVVISNLVLALLPVWFLYAFVVHRGFPGPWRVYVFVCLGGLVLGARAVLWEVMRGPYPSESSNSGRVIDVAKVLGCRPLTKGRRGRVARLPFNEIFQVEVIERHIGLRGLPVEWEGLSILHLSDLHFNGTPGREYFEYVFERAAELAPDMVALTGDIVDYPEMVEWIPTTLGLLRPPEGAFYVLGNHDVPDRRLIRPAVEELGWTRVGGLQLTREIRGRTLFVAGTERPWIGREHPDVGQMAGADFRLLLSHTPSVTRWALSKGFDLMLAGHLHGGQVRLPVIGPPRAGLRFGVYEYRGLVQHVSRGLGQRRPIRFRCRPEICKLVLHAARV